MKERFWAVPLDGAIAVIFI